MKVKVIIVTYVDTDGITSRTNALSAAESVVRLCMDNTHPWPADTYVTASDDE